MSKFDKRLYAVSALVLVFTGVFIGVRTGTWWILLVWSLLVAFYAAWYRYVTRQLASLKPAPVVTEHLKGSCAKDCPGCQYWRDSDGDY